MDRTLFDAPSHGLALEGLDALTEVEAPAVDLSKLPSASLAAGRRFVSSGGDTVALAGCARAPSARWVPGLEHTLFEKATYLMLRTSGSQPAGLHLVGQGSDPRAPSVTLAGADQRGDLRVEHVLTFVGPERDVLLCSLTCSGPGCAASQLVVVGEPPAPPPPGALASLATRALTHPTQSAASLGFVALLAAAWVLWRRPYPRP